VGFVAPLALAGALATLGNARGLASEWGFWGGEVDEDYSIALTRLHDGSAACGSESLRRGGGC